MSGKETTGERAVNVCLKQTPRISSFFVHLAYPKGLSEGEGMLRFGRSKCRRLSKQRWPDLKPGWSNIYAPTFRGTIAVGARNGTDRRSVRMQESRQYGFVTERDICLYLTLVATLGGNFDSDPQLPWAKTMLTDSTVREPSIRIDRLTDHAMEFLDRTVGKKDHYLNLSVTSGAE